MAYSQKLSWRLWWILCTIFCVLFTGPNIPVSWWCWFDWRHSEKKRKMLIHYTVTLFIEASQFRLTRQSKHTQSCPDPHTQCCIGSERWVVSVHSISRLRTGREGAWPDKPPALSPSSTHRDSNPVLTSASQFTMHPCQVKTVPATGGPPASRPTSGHERQMALRLEQRKWFKWRWDNTKSQFFLETQIFCDV